MREDYELLNEWESLLIAWNALRNCLDYENPIRFSTAAIWNKVGVKIWGLDLTSRRASVLVGNNAPFSVTHDRISI